MSYENSSEKEHGESQAQKTSEPEHRDQSAGERPAGVAPVQAETETEETAPAGVAEPEPDREPVSIDELLPAQASGASLVPVPGDSIPEVAQATLDTAGETPSSDLKASIEAQLGEPVTDISLHAGQKATEATEALGVHAFVLDTDVVVNQRLRDSLGRADTHLLAQQLVNAGAGSGAPAVLASDGAAADNTTETSEE